MSHQIKTQAHYESISKAINYDFNDRTILTIALTHKSAADKDAANKHGFNNERLEFLGDAVLSLITANYLYRQHGFMNEGELSRLRAQFVCQENLSLAARAFKLGDFILSDRAMRASGSNHSKAILADALEALIGAVFIDGGLASAEEVIFKILGFPSAKLANIEKDAKTKLQELVQSNIKGAPKYVVLESTGPAHSPTFLVGVKINDIIVAKATGENKKSAAQNAAMLALNMLSLQSSKVDAH